MNKEKLKTILRSLLVVEDKQLRSVSYDHGGKRLSYSSQHGVKTHFEDSKVDCNYQTVETINIEGFIELLANIIDEEKLKQIMQ